VAQAAKPPYHLDKLSFGRLFSNHTFHQLRYDLPHISSGAVRPIGTPGVDLERPGFRACDVPLHEDIALR
jgi:hypothetical protein